LASSILNDVKKMLGLAPDYPAFDLDVTVHINSVLSILNQLGVGPDAGFMIMDSTATWDDFIGATDPRLNIVKSYMFLRVQMLFDPSSNSFVIESKTKQYQEMEVRMSIQREATAWTDPNPPQPQQQLLTDPFWWDGY
jgi:hypothetical protein